MQVGIDIKCMHTNFGGRDSSGFVDMATFQKRPNFPFKFSTFLLGHCDVLMGALCTNNKEIHDKLKFLQLGKDVVRQRILSVVIELSHIFCIFLYILVNLSILLCSSSTFVNFCVFLYTSVFSLFVSVY